ncbi:MAG: C10 family peptidase, partial [Muribaculaceae bacterium]|nr:C10 family peptidase [Muribaculaceae bacterium]
TYTGCVATSMAQVMHYWQYPEKGTGTVTYTAETLQKKLSLNFSQKKFDWDNMLPTYIEGQYNQVQADAVAYLMKACGYAVHMEYGIDSSGALAMDVRNAMYKYFNYDGNMKYTLRCLYSTDEWYEMMYTNLKDVGPVIYGGGSMLGGGHSFVCDGYDKETNMFHFNWGWTGMSNGYFSLDALNPEALGTGGGTGGGYNFTQDAVFGIQPPTGEPVIPQEKQLTQQGSLIAEIADDTIIFDLDMQEGAMWVNYNPSKMNVELWASITRQGSAEPVMEMVVSAHRYPNLQPGYGFAAHNMQNGVDYGANPTVQLADLRENLADGTYTLTFKTRDYEVEDAPLIDILCPYAYYNYITITKAGNDIKVQDYMAPSLDIVSAEFTSKVLAGGIASLKVTISNPSDIQLTTGLAPLLVYDNNYQYIGESVFLTVNPHETITREWVTAIQPMTQYPSTGVNMDMYLFDEESYLFYVFDGTEKAMVQPYVEPDISLTNGMLNNSNPYITNAARSATVKDGSQTIYQYYIDNPYDIQVMTRYKINSGYFAYPLYSVLVHQEEGGMAIMAYGGENVMYESSTLTRSFRANISYNAMGANEVYNIMTAYYDGTIGFNPVTKGGNTVQVIYETAGVDNVSVDKDNLTIDYDRATRSVTALSTAGIATVTAYSVNGMQLGTVTGDDSDRATLSLDSAAGGLVIIKAIDNNGNTKTTKLVL